MQKKCKSLNAHSLSFFKFSLAALLFLSSQVFAQSISLNSDIGKIQKIQEGSNGKTLIFIEEAHADYDAQKSMVQILRSVISQESLRLILVEGGWKDMSLSDLRIYGTREGREKIAEKYLQEGKISAEEYLDIIGDYELLLRGIENPELYASNMKAFLKFHELQAATLLQLDIFQSGLAKLQDRIYGKALKELEARRKAVQAGSLSLMTYLPDLARRAGVDLQNYPLTYQLCLLMGESYTPPASKILRPSFGGTQDDVKVKVLDLDKAAKEKRELIGALSRRVSKIELAPVRERLEFPKQDDEIAILQEAFEILNRYPDLARRNPYPNLRAYLAALEKTQSLDFQNLSREILSLESLAREKIGLSEDEKILLSLSHFSERLHQLLKLELSPALWETLKMDLERWNPASVRQEMTRLAKKPKEVAGAVEALEPLWKNIPDAKAFYEAALEREDALIENTLREMQESPDAAAVVITGGFHTERMLQEIRQQGFTVLKATPHFEPKNTEESQKKYFQLLKDRWLGSQTKNEKSEPLNPKSETNSNTQIQNSKQAQNEK